MPVLEAQCTTAVVPSRLLGMAVAWMRQSCAQSARSWVGEGIVEGGWRWGDITRRLGKVFIRRGGIATGSFALTSVLLVHTGRLMVAPLIRILEGPTSSKADSYAHIRHPDEDQATKRRMKGRLVIFHDEVVPDQVS